MLGRTGTPQARQFRTLVSRSLGAPVEHRGSDYGTYLLGEALQSPGQREPGDHQRCRIGSAGISQRRVPAQSSQRGLIGQGTDSRLFVVDAAGVRVASVRIPYAPCGDSTQHQVRRSIQAKMNGLRCLSECSANQPGTQKRSFLCGDFNVVLDGESEPNTLNRSPMEREALTSRCASGFVDLYRDFRRGGRSGCNSGTPNTSPPDTRFHLILRAMSFAPHVNSSAWASNTGGRSTICQGRSGRQAPLLSSRSIRLERYPNNATPHGSCAAPTRRSDDSRVYVASRHPPSQCAAVDSVKVAHDLSSIDAA